MLHFGQKSAQMPQPVATAAWLQKFSQLDALEVHTGDTHLVHERVRVYDLGNKDPWLAGGVGSRNLRVGSDLK